LNPFGDNEFISKLNEVREKIKMKDLQQQQSALKSDSSLAKLLASGRFIYSQGLVGGFFILVGLLGTSSQLLTSSARTEDEFTTAIRVATEKKIPIRLADAPQNDTLQSISTVISPELFDPVGLYYGTRDLIFSFLGLLPSLATDKRSVETIPTNVMKNSKWINIPKAYSETPQLLKSMLPILVTTSLLLILEIMADGSGSSSGGFTSAVSAVTTTDVFDSSSTSASVASMGVIPGTLSSILHQFLSSILSSSIDPSTTTTISSTIDNSILLNTDMSSSDSSENVEILLASMLHFLEFSFLVRLSKIIGTRRDAILARNIQGVSKEFQGGNIVVVNGMLHSNGVARWLLSGQTPTPITATDPDPDPNSTN